MPIGKDYRLAIGMGREVLPPGEDREGATTDVCTAALQSYPTGSSAQVECLIDNSSFGPLPFSGTIYQPHPCDLSAGGHHFRIRQMSGSFFFLSLTVWKV